MELENKPLVLDCAIGDKFRMGFINLLKEGGFRVVCSRNSSLIECLDPLSDEVFGFTVGDRCWKYKPDLLVLPLSVYYKKCFYLTTYATNEAKRFGNLVIGVFDGLKMDDWNVDGLNLIIDRLKFTEDEDYRNEMIDRMKSLVLEKSLAGSPSTCIVSDTNG